MGILLDESESVLYTHTLSCHRDRSCSRYLSALLRPRSTLLKSRPGLLSSSTPSAFLLPALSRSASFSAHKDSAWLAMPSAPILYWLILCTPSAKMSTAGPKSEVTLLTREAMSADRFEFEFRDLRMSASDSESVSRSTSESESFSVGGRSGIDGGRNSASKASFSERNLHKLA